jgi:hypothetical protein
MATVYQAGRGRETLQNKLAYPAFNGLPRIINLWHTSHCSFRYEYAKNPVASPRTMRTGAEKR